MIYRTRRDDLCRKKGMMRHSEDGPVDIYRTPDGLAIDFTDPKLVKLVRGQASGKFAIPFTGTGQSQKIV